MRQCRTQEGNACDGAAAQVNAERKTARRRRHKRRKKQEQHDGHKDIVHRCAVEWPHPAMVRRGTEARRGAHICRCKLNHSSPGDAMGEYAASLSRAHPSPPRAPCGSLS